MAMWCVLKLHRSVWGEVLEKREEMIAYLKKLGFSYLTMDLEGFRSGSMDEKITQKEETK